MSKNTQLKKYVDCYGPDSAFAIANFTTAGTGAVTVGESQGISSIVRTGPGVFEITFARAWKNICVTLGLQHTTQAATPVVTSVTPATRKVVVSMLAGATGTETTGAVIHVQALLRVAV
jgi:hypothetical protein